MNEELEDISAVGLIDSDDDGEFEAVDYRFLTPLASKKDYVLPARGEKDFEPDGTNKQDKILQSSRDAMYEAVSVEREISAKNHIKAFWISSLGLARLDAKDAKGSMFRNIGRTDKSQITWLLPEEILYLVERGNIECFYESVDVSMSLQAAYAECLPLVGLDKFQVYAYLKRAGYMVLRAGSEPPAVSNVKVTSVFSRLAQTLSRLASILATNLPSHAGHAKIYRSFAQLYKSLQVVPYHHPLKTEFTENPESNDLRLTYDIWKPNAAFRKSNPGEPDFRLSVVSAQGTSLPSLTSLDSLFASLPLSTTKTDKKKPIAETDEQKRRNGINTLKQGYRTFILAVVDLGVISFLNVGDVAFGNHFVYEEYRPKQKPQRRKPNEISGRIT